VQSRIGQGDSDGHKVQYPTDPVSGAIEWTLSWQKSGNVNGIYVKILKEEPLPPLAADTDDGTCSGEIVANTTANEGKRLARQNGRTLTTHAGSAQYCAQVGDHRERDGVRLGDALALSLCAPELLTAVQDGGLQEDRFPIEFAAQGAERCPEGVWRAVHP
jgi:hypothetical protein